MAGPDTAAAAQLGREFFTAAWIAYLDFQGDPVRATTARVSLSFAATGDADLDGHSFDAVDPSLIGIGDIKSAESGSETLPFTLSGIVGPDSDLLNIVGDTSKWRGRTARLWAVIYDQNGTQQGAVWPIYTGRMSALQIVGAPDSQTVKLDVENYLASLKQASGRTYLDQALFDPGDNTASLMIGVANGATKGVAAANPAPIAGFGGFGVSGNWPIPY